MSFESTYITISRSLKAARLAAGLTQNQLATKVDSRIDAGMIGRIERNQQTYSLNMLNRLLKALNLSLGQLLSQTQPHIFESKSGDVQKKLENLFKVSASLDENQLIFLTEVAKVISKYKVMPSHAKMRAASKRAGQMGSKTDKKKLNE